MLLLRPNPHRFIGYYWLKQADKLIIEHINRIQTANGVSRFEWQVLKSALRSR